MKFFSRRTFQLPGLHAMRYKQIACHQTPDTRYELPEDDIFDMHASLV
jgi:hypothetical protein